MRYLLFPSALVLTLSPVALANSEDAAEWPELDRELEALNEALTADTNGPRLWGYVRTSFAKSDEIRDPAGTALGGVLLDNVRLAVDGNVERYSYRVSGDLAGGTLQLEDAYVDVTIGEGIYGTIGQFKSPFLRSGMVEARDLLFIARSRNGVFASIRDQGVKFAGDHDRFHWGLAAQNGADGASNRVLLSARADVDVIGEPLPAWEGAYSSGDQARLNLALGYQDDGAASDAGALAVEATAIFGSVYIQGEMVDYGDDWSFDPNFPGEQRGGTTPWSITTSVAMPNDRWEFALRYDDYDDVQAPADFDRTLFTAGANYYVSGHDLKWQFNYGYGRNAGTDDNPDTNIVALGLTLAF